MTLRINKNLQTSELAQKFKSQNRIHIANFIQQQDAYKLSDYVKSISEWNLSLNSAEKQFDVTHEHRKSVQPDFYQQLKGITEWHDFVPADDVGKAAARERYKTLKQAGFEITTSPIPDSIV